MDQPHRAPSPAAVAPEHGIAIIGTGFSGLCMAWALRRAGREDFVLLERAHEVGGTWRDNHYPGAACDVPSHLYSLSFAPKSDWSRVYPAQPELLAYLREVADRFDLRRFIRFGHEVLGADYDEHAQLWRLTTAGGPMTARVLVAGNGPLAEPRAADLPGLARFAGAQFHSATWDHAVPLAGKRVAVIGTGASAVQFVPEIVDGVAQLDLYQRTPNWILPRPDRAYGTLAKWSLRHVPGLRTLYRAGIYWRNEGRVLGFVVHPALMRLPQRKCEKFLAAQVADPVLRDKLTPRYAVGCKRVLISNDWYAALQRPNLELVTTPIREVTRDAIVDADGRVRPTDVLIHATGFYATENPIAARIRGRGGVSLAQTWQDGEQAYLGTLVHGFPNLMLVIGPNTGLGHNSMVFMIETQVAYIARLLELMQRERASTLEVHEPVQRAFNEALQLKLSDSVWATGCKSWYQHRSGKITTLWPGFTFDFWRRTRAFDEGDYALQRLSARGG
ncbi:MAG: NAD(P)/FAD-dependent oxidoreductase [Nannocystaceae bacterium]|nr:NAD(P)/FAD-dependent oxidoreductase [Nannocystaceae bacterium]